MKLIKQFVMQPAMLVLLAFIVFIGVAIPVYAYTYSAQYTVSENASTDYDMLGVWEVSNNLWMANNGFMNSTANDTRIETLGGSDKPHMVTENMTFTAIPVPANSQTNLYFTTGNSELDSMYIIPGYGGYFTVADDADLELSDNFSIELEDTYVNTDAGASKYLIAHYDATIGGIRCLVSPTVSENVTTSIHSHVLSYVAANTDWLDMGDDDDFSFTDGFGNDHAFSITGWLNFDAGSVESVILCKNDGGAHREWDAILLATGKLPFLLRKEDGTAYIGRSTDDISVYFGQWIHLACTYDGSEISDGVKIYINGIQSDTAPLTGGAYTGMTNTAIHMTSGSFSDGASSPLNGDMVELSLYNKELTPSEIVDDMRFIKASDLVMWLRMHENAGNAADSSGNGHTGTNNGADWVDTSVSATATGIVSGGYDDIISSANTSHLNIYIDSILKDSTVLRGIPVPDSSANWTFMNNATTDFIPYSGNITIEVDGDLEAWYEPNDMISGTTLPDREPTGGDNDGTFSWGANPAGVYVTLGSMASSGQPGLGIDVTETPEDVLGEVEVSDWFEDPDVAGALLTNPLRPFVTMLSDTTTMTEIQAWRLLGLAFVLGVAMITVTSVRNHLLIAGIATGAAIYALVHLTIWPMWALVFVAAAVLAGIIAERSPSV